MTEPHEYLPEDVGDGDATSEALFTDERATAIILAREDAVVAGIEEAQKLFESEGLLTVPKFRDGQHLKGGDEVMSISGDAKAILRIERLALNFICKMSGIASTTRELVDKCAPINPDVKISATRKTTPGFREYEKKAVVLGGGVSHRTGLYDQILIKDNHLKLAPSIALAIEKARAHTGPDGRHYKVEVEVTDMGMAIEAAKASPDIIMLDNMEPFEVEAVSKEIRVINPEIEIEISGGITPDNIVDYAKFADVISLGWLTHSTRARNFSLEIVGVAQG